MPSRLLIALLCLLVGLPVASSADAEARGRAAGAKRSQQAGQAQRDKRSKRTKRSKRSKRAKKPRIVTRDRVERGTHWRINDPSGVIHVWRPRGFRRQRGGIVVYVHGYRSSADKTWANRAIAEQFRKSRQNALFIVVDAPASIPDKVKFPALSKLLAIVARHTRLRLPRGHIVAIGHSAAYRTIVNWLDYRYLDHVILVDALYAHGPEFEAWMTTHKHRDWHKLIVISYDTLSQTQRFLKKFKRVQRRKAFPERYLDFSKAERRAPLLFIRSQYGHAQLISSKKVIPLLLRLTRLALLGRRARK